ncbi:MAG: hypothetical protein ACOH2D_06790 [Gelidibacter sp.]
MFSFLKKILFFSLPILLISYPLDLYISDCLKTSKIINSELDGEFEVWNDIYDGNLKANMLITGSSRAWVNISPKILEDSLNTNVYNLGLNGHNFWLEYMRHLEYLKYNTKPKQIILAVDFGSLNKRDNLYRYEQFLPYMLWNKNIKHFTESYEGFRFYDYDIPLIRYIGKSRVIRKSLKSYSHNDINLPVRVQGYTARNLKWSSNINPNEIKERIRNANKKSDPASVKLFDAFLLECQQSDISVTLVYTPEYNGGQEFIKSRESSIKIFKSFAQKYHIPFLDYSQNSISYNKDNFYNVTHLNKTGSEIFSKLLAHDLLKIEEEKNMINHSNKTP